MAEKVKLLVPLDASEIERQENLSIQRIRNLNIDSVSNTTHAIDDTRPKESLIELAKWVKNKFSDYLSDNTNTNIFVHNVISIDGEFLSYCEINNISVKTLYKDSVISWRSFNDCEKFFAQGVFLIKSKDAEFIMSSLFHKGHENEDEVSFFVIVSELNYEKYIQLRNDFEDWSKNRERNDLQVRVVGGEDIPYSQDHSWDDLFLPNNIKQDIKNTVEVFLSSKDFYEQYNLPWKRGVLLYGEPGCHIKGTPIMMSDGSWKKVEDVEVGDFLMGPDREQREVLRLVRGRENMYKISPQKGKSFIVNENHILHLQHSESPTSCPKVCNIAVKDYLNLSKCLREKLKLVKFTPPKVYPDNLHNSRNFALQTNTNKNRRMVGISFVEPVGIDDFYGFTVDKDHLYIMDDFWITHNCGKTSIIRTIISNYNFKPVTVLPSSDASSLREAFMYAEEQNPSLLYFEDLDSLLQKVDISEFLNLMDGISAKNGLLVIATANDISKFKTNITDRPSRFDRKIEIPPPDTTMAISYMKKMFGTSVPIDKIRYLAKVVTSHCFSYAYIKELYISSMFEAISNNRKKPTEKDIYSALDKIMKDKNIIKSGKVNMNKYFSKKRG